MMQCSFNQRGALLLLVILSGCGTPPAPRRVEVTEPALPMSFEFTTASPPASASSNPPAPATSAVASSATPPTPAAIPFSAEEIAALTTERRSRRVFRHVLVGNMPGVRQRDSWMLSKDGRELTLTCEHADPESMENVAEGNPEPPRWVLVGSASFVAADLVPGQAIASHYQRTGIRVIPKPVDKAYCDQRGYDWYGCSQRSWTTCGDIGEELALACTQSKLPLLGPNALVHAEGSGDEGYVISWRPSARRPVTGLSCVVSAPQGDPDAFDYYDFTDDSAKSTLFFADRPAVERLVHSSGLHYVGFREAVLKPFDGSLPPYLGGTAKVVGPSP
jgi:hypothetical protein